MLIGLFSSIKSAWPVIGIVIVLKPGSISNNVEKVNVTVTVLPISPAVVVSVKAILAN